VGEQFGLLTNDSVIVATLRDAGVSAIATADRDFERVDGLQVFRPSDLDLAAPASGRAGSCLGTASCGTFMAC
jgi:hypothetical protein